MKINENLQKLILESIIEKFHIATLPKLKIDLSNLQLTDDLEDDLIILAEFKITAKELKKFQNAPSHPLPRKTD